MYARCVAQVEARCVEGQRAWEGMERDLQLLRDEVDDRYASKRDVIQDMGMEDDSASRWLHEA